MKRDCECDDDLGALNHVGGGRLAEAYDEVLDEPEGDLGELDRRGASRVELLDEAELADIEMDDGELDGIELDDVDLEGVDLEDVAFDEGGEVGFIKDVIDGGKAILDELTRPTKRKANRARQSADRERGRAERLRDELDREKRARERERHRDQVARERARQRQAETKRRQEMAELEARIVDLRNQQALVRRRLQQAKKERRRKWMMAGGGLLAAGTMAYATKAAKAAQRVMK